FGVAEAGRHHHGFAWAFPARADAAGHGAVHADAAQRRSLVLAAEPGGRGRRRCI
ncbi:unnamed protein product, partial [Effrenium voratum]